MKKILLTIVVVLFACFYAAAQDASVNKMDSKNQKQGAWEEKTSTGVIKGQYVDDKKEGNWISYGTTGAILKIESYSKGFRQGLTLEIDLRGYLSSESYYDHDLLEGVAKKFYYGSNPASIIDYKHGKMNGRKKVYYENSAGKLSEDSEYKDDVKNGTSNFYALNGDPIAEYVYVNGSLEGIQKSYYAGKKLMSEQNYVNNVESGLYKEYYESGKLKIEGNYKNGKMDGKWMEYTEDGKLKSDGLYLDGEKEGKWTEYGADGKAVKVTKFVKGVEKK